MQAVLLAATRLPPIYAKAAAAAFGLFALYAGLKVSPVITGVFCVCLAMLGVAGFLASWVLGKDEGTAEMQEVGAAACWEGREGPV